MKKITVFLLSIVFAGGLYAETKFQERPVRSIIISRPVNAGTEDSKSKDTWAVALLDRFLRFRLEPLKEIKTVPSSEIQAMLPDLNNFSKGLADSDFFTLATRQHFANILLTKFEIVPKSKSLQLFIEVQSVKDLKIIAQEERNISLDSLSSGIDTCLTLIIKRISAITSNESIRFLQIPVISNNYRNARRLGELFVDEMNTPIDETFKEYSKIIEKDPYMLLAYYAGGFAGFNSKNYGQAASYFKQLLDLAPLHTGLYFPLAQSYRFSGQLNEALNTVIHCERIQIKSVDLLLEKALIFEGLNQRGHALSIHQQVLNLNPSQPQSLLYLAKEKNNAAQFQEALECANRLINVSPDNGFAHYERSRSLSALKQYDKSYEAIQKAAELLPSDPLVQEWKGDLHLKNQRFADAAKVFHSALQHNPDNFDLYIKTARSMALDNRTLDALNLLKQLEQRFADKPILKKEIGLLEFSERNIAKALPLLESYCATVADDGDALLALGKMYIQTADYDKAVSILNKALQTTADKIICRLYLSSAYLSKKEYATCRTLLEQVIAERPLKDAHRMMAEQFLATGDLRSSLTHFMKERELHGETVALQEHIALLHFKLGFFVPSKTEFSRLIELAPKHQYALYYIAILHLREGDMKSAEYFLEDARKLGPGTDEIFYQLGMFYKQHNSFEKSVASFNKSLEFNASSERALLGSTEAYSKLGNDSAVAELYIRLFNINNAMYSPNLASAGHLFLKKKLFAQAEKVYAQFLSKGYKDFSVNIAYASIEQRRNNSAKVIELLEKPDNAWKQDQQVASMLADAYNATGKFTQALPWCNVLLSKDQNNRLAIRVSANAFEKTGDTISALSMYERYIKLPPDEHRAMFLFRSGELYELRGMNSNAISRFETALKEFPDDLRNHEHLGNLYMNRKSYTDARRVLKAAVEFPHATPKLQKMLAQTNVALNNLDDAEELYQKYLARVGNDAQAWKELGSIYFSRNQYTQALGPLVKATELRSDDFDCFKMLGISHVRLKNFSMAIAPLGKARMIDKNSIQIIELSAMCYRNLNETTSLAALLREWMVIDPKRFDTKMELGKILLEEKNISEAIAMFEDAIRFIPTEPAPYLFLSKAYEIQGNDSIRLFYLTSSLKYSQPNWEIHYQLARYYISKNNMKNAEIQLQKSIDLNPSHAPTHFEYGNLYASQDNYSKALSEYRLALASEANNPLYLILVAYALSKTNNAKSALDYCTIALGKNTSDPRVTYWAGMTYYESGRKESAYQLLNDALKLDPSSAIVYEALGDLNLSDFKFAEASENYFKSWEKGGFNEKRAFKLGTSLSYSRKHIESRDFFETILSRNPGHELALYKVIESSCEIGDLKKARKLLTQFTSNSTPWMQLAQGKIYETEKNPDAALVAYSIARRISPNHAYVHAGLGRVYLQKANYDSAITYLSTATVTDSLNMQSLIDLGIAFERMGDKNSAYLYLSEVDRRYPAHPEVHMLMAHIKFEQKEYPAVAHVLERGIEYHPDDTNLHLLLGQAFEEQKKYDQAIESYQTALKKGKGQPIEALRYIGNIYYEKLVNNKKAKEYYKRYVKAGGNDQQVNDMVKKLEGI